MSVSYLRSLPAVRERSQQVFDLIVQGHSDHWDYHPEHLPAVVDFCAALIKRDFGTDYASIPPHCRRNHFNAGEDRIAKLVPLLPQDKWERTKSLIDLYFVSVLLDAGAGNDWVYSEDGGWKGGRSEGLAVATYHMFLAGVFSSSKDDPYRVDSSALKAITPESLGKYMQVSPSNPMAGLEGRASLLAKLGEIGGRPSDFIDAFKGEETITIAQFWDKLFALVLPIWPARTTLDGVVLGDVWPCPSLGRVNADKGGDLVPFHKLTQWLCYSLLEPMRNVAGVQVVGGEMTGLPEYRNGGLLVDLGLLSFRDLPDSAYPNGRDAVPVLEPGHPAVVEWRAATVILLDKVHKEICLKLGISETDLTLVQVLEASTWKGGREIAKKLRPETSEPPIAIVSDGTVFVSKP